MKYKFSVIIPVYNAEKTICRCVDSLLTQNDSRTEIILVNDGSKDRSGEICREYAQKNDCVVYVEQENAGASAARNKGLSMARGTYITFVDSDDYVSDGYFDALDCPDDELVVFSYRIIRSDGERDYRFGQELLNAESHKGRVLEIIRERLAGPVNKRFKRSVIEENQLRFKNDLIIGEDFIFGLEYMLLSCSSSVVNGQLYCVDETNMGSVTRAAKYDSTQFVRIYAYAFEIAKTCGWDDADKEQLIQLLDYLYCRTAFASTQHLLNSKRHAYMQVAELIRLFREQLNRNIKPMNTAHAAMRACIKGRTIPVFILIALLHRLFVRG